MKKLIFLLFVFLAWHIALLAQCQTDIDFNTWSQEGFSSNGIWTVQGGGSSVLQTINGDPTFYVSPDTFINVEISGRIRIDNSFDDDFVGFVFGYQEPDAIPTQYDFWLFDWKGVQQPKGSFGQYLAQEGFTLSRILGNIPAGNNNYWPNFWAHDSSATCNPIATDYGSTRGWLSFTDYNFTLLYTPTRTTILINNDTIFDVPGCYEPGRFGFYNYSLENVTYSDFSYRLISNFEVEFNDYDQCEDVPFNFVFTDSTCAGGTSVTSNIASWAWDFGDGTSSTQPNPPHVFDTAGTYAIQLLVTDVNGCQDSVTKTVTVHPPPFVTVAADTIHCPSDTVFLNASGGTSYQWQPFTGLSDPFGPNPFVIPTGPITYTVTVIDQFDCIADTSVSIRFFEATVSNGTVICEGESTLLGAAGGIQYAWTPASSLDDPTLATPTASPLTTTTYQAVVTDAYGCTDTVFQTITVNPRPVLSIGPDTTVCANEPVTFLASGASSYSWLDELGNLLGSGNSQTLNFPSSSWVYVLGTDGNGCQNIDSIELNVLPLPIVDAGPDLAICSYETVTIGSATNPTGTYSWSPASTLSDPASLTPVFSPTNAGTFPFTLTLTDLNGCTNTDQLEVTVHPFELTETHTDVLCFGENNGTSTLTLNATGPFSYFWLDSLGNAIQHIPISFDSYASLDSLFAGNYLGIAIDGFGCTDTIPVQINEPTTPLAATLTNLVDVDCFGNANGEFHVAASGGTPGYQYSIDGGFNFQSSGSFTGLGPTIYTVMVLDSNQCEASVTDTIQTPTGLFGEITVLKHIDCFGANNGAFALVGQGGSPPYQYSFDNVNFSNNLSVTNLAPGPDTVFFFDNNGCQVTLPFEIFEPPQLIASITDIKGIDCFGNGNGQIWLTTSGGTPDYQFSLDGLNFQSDSTFANLEGGPDTLLIQDDSLCLVEIPFDIAEPAALTTNIISQQNVDCFGNATGELVLQANGGIPAYLFSLDSLPFQSDNVFLDLAAGTYTVTLVDDSSCVNQLTVDITEPPLLELFNDVQANVDCNGNNTGFVLLNGDGGTLPYQFSLDNVNFQLDSLFQNLGAGLYTFFVVDDSNCVEQITATITEPAPLQVLVDQQIDIDCFGNDNGSVLLSGVGGVEPYLFGLDGGVLQTGGSFGSLVPGLHTIRIQDDSLCSNEIEISIFEPPLLEVSATHTDVVCFGFDDGTGTVKIVGGTPVYEILWDSPIPQTTQTASNLGPGPYQVVVTDANGCAETASIDVFEPDTLTLTIVDGSFVEAYCNWDNGEAAVEAAGGILPYTYRWEGPNLREGPSATQLFGDTTYTAIVTDSNGCKTAIPVFIPQVPPATPIFASDPSFEDSILFSQANVQFLNQSIGAVAYQWEFGDGAISDEVDPQHQYLETGVYSITLTAFNSYFVCPTDTTITLHIIPDGALFVPNAFTPNDDGHNDFFFPVGEGLITYELHIFNRWGRKVVTLSSLADQWDGRNENGRPVPEGVYVYRVTALMNNGNQVDQGGTVTVIR